MYRTIDGDMLDAICLAYYGKVQNVEERVLAANPHLAEIGPVYESGILIELPEISTESTQKIIRLWD